MGQKSGKVYGIYLQYGPRQEIRSQGISRLLALIAKGINDLPDAHLVVATLPWTKEDLLEHFKDHGLHENGFRILSNKKSVLWDVSVWWQVFYEQVRAKKAELDWKVSLGFAQAKATLSSWMKSLRLAEAKKTLLGWRVFSKLAPVKRNLKKRRMFRKLKHAKETLFSLKIPHRIAQIILLLIQRVIKAIITLVLVLIAIVRGMPSDEKTAAGINKKISIERRMYEALLKRETQRLVALANSRSDVDVWFVPVVSWDEAAKLRKKIVMAVPDLIYEEFPQWYKGPIIDMVRERAEKLMSRADKIITYSEHVRKTHILETQDISPDKVRVIRHAPICLNEYLESDLGDISLMQKRADSILTEYLSKKPGSGKNELVNIPYIFYASQPRYHKNLINLVCAFEIYVQSTRYDLRLVLTADPSIFPPLKKEIEKRGLNRRVVSIPFVPPHVLAALYAKAEVSVNPTLFEGGFPFTFAEAYSVGTPSIMSRIPVVLEQLTGFPELIKVMTFDPEDIEDMARCIDVAVSNPRSLYQQEHALWEKLAKRTWKTVAEEYRRVFDEVICQQTSTVPRLQ